MKRLYNGKEVEAKRTGHTLVLTYKSKDCKRGFPMLATEQGTELVIFNKEFKDLEQMKEYGTFEIDRW